MSSSSRWRTSAAHVLDPFGSCLARRGDVGHGSEMRGEQGGRLAIEDPADRGERRLEVDLGRGKRRPNGACPWEVGADRLAREHRAAPVVVQGDVMRGMSGRVEYVQRAGAQRYALAVDDGTDARSGDGTHVSEERTHPFLAVGARGGRGQARGVDQVARTRLVDPDRGAWVAHEQRTGAAGVVHVDVRDHHVCEIVRVDAERIERCSQPVVIGTWAGLHQAGLWAVQQVDRVQFSFARHHGIDGGDPRRDGGGAVGVHDG